ncbi:hypothetical protein JGS22_012285 [Streptomyces sp. P38-E01]|uniref:Uncharacterized protein n=1 Tax=Streptomyces tardus TaxID=2780544 RepID=A0A949JE27_9ACTN|nr:hypothetical protein [Streptomyces tardus]MBU7598373.1 hypothetical protein [Streptomyces tardus]
MNEGVPSPRQQLGGVQEAPAPLLLAQREEIQTGGDTFRVRPLPDGVGLDPGGRGSRGAVGARRGLGRILGRQRALRRESWAVERLDLCVERLREPEFHEQLWTDGLTVPMVAERLAAAAGLEPAPDTASPVRGSLRRGWTSLKHIRRL